jgi:hypothetical protein
MVHKITKSKTPKWWEDKDFSYSDVGEDANVWRTSYKGFQITVYPVKLYNKNSKGWEYKLFNPKKIEHEEWDSLFETSEGGDHASDSETAKRWAINTVNEWE